MVSSNKFAALAPIVRDICRTSGIPGIALGVLHEGEVVYTAAYGFADVEKQLPCDEDTTFVLGSLTKAMTAALDVPLKTILPDFNRSDAYGDATIADLLCHRTGLAALDSLWLASDNVPFLARSQAVHILNHAPATHAFRSHFVYNNFAYEVLGQVIEKVSGASFADLLQDRLLTPLGMTRTYYTGECRENEAKPYAALENASVVQIAPPLKGKDVLMGAAGGIRSSVNDLLSLYSAFISRARDEMTFSDSEAGQKIDHQPLEGVLDLWQGHTLLPSRSLRERSYAYGWARTQLPGILSPGDNGKSELDPMVGTGAPSRLALHHGGSIPGFNTYNALFPETGSAVVVLSNSLSLNGGVRWIGELLIEALFNNLDNAQDYGKLARMSVASSLERHINVNKSLADGRTAKTPTRPLDSYVGRYLNSIGNFFIDVEHHEDSLYVSYMGRDADTFELVPYQEDSFYWRLSYDDCVKLARETGYDKEYFIIRFGSDVAGSDVTHLWWRHEYDLPEPGESFHKIKEELVPPKPIPGEL
ncbi:beta-lactamase/transpeptidase-like protein [Ilyonectria robusta]|uniref:beta-lactamase/transpeptidase-like protein n=1 Tax=Ilyonectria robusta TaxID=1079257 RepID=UPI001E8D54A8|nr:beta-lactamase/transpeptidase-like protein [Ilyonectria robusta]KAH8734316.1 beta-lactamase/transpeptidase-like protein [Ilyonectria robusta]